MHRITRTALAGTLASAGLVLTTAAPATAQPIVTGGLVNVVITDVIDDVTVTIEDINVGLALQLAANVCDVSVNVLAEQLESGDVSCSTATQTVRIEQA